MADLKGRVAVVAGASRGDGKGIALALGDKGATVYVAGRTSAHGSPPADGAPGSVEQTAEEVTRRGGLGIAVAVDCTDERQVAELFKRVANEQQRLDVLANAVWGAADVGQVTMEDWATSWTTPFWDQSVTAWQRMMNAGPTLIS